jgi:methyl-accepting chemotaxis protein
MFLRLLYEFLTELRTIRQEVQTVASNQDRIVADIGKIGEAVTEMSADIGTIAAQLNDFITKAGTLDPAALAAAVESELKPLADSMDTAVSALNDTVAALDTVSKLVPPAV